MAARLNPKHDKRTRDKIKTSQLINRLNSFVEGKVEMSSGQVNAAKILLGKTLPDLKAMEHSGGLDHKFTKDPDSITDAELAALATAPSGGATPKA